MLQSTHYELKLVEGSDIVNPLVIDRPNYEAIDDVMYENESKSVGSATELKSGTIHALTRSKGNQRFFCFTATSNYEAGDTFTVDSVPVTALLPNGTSLPDMAYVINGTVLCSLIGTLLTVYTVGAGLADDSLRLGGQLPEYYATASALTSVSNTASSAQTMAVNNSNAIVEINSNLTYTVLATGTPNTTYATQLTALKDTYYSLSDEDKRRCKIEEVFPDNVTIIVLHMFGVNNGSFFNISVASNAVYGSTYTISNGTAYTSNNNTVTNKTSTSTDHTLRLVKY